MYDKISKYSSLLHLGLKDDMIFDMYKLGSIVGNLVFTDGTFARWICAKALADQVAALPDFVRPIKMYELY